MSRILPFALLLVVASVPALAAPPEAVTINSQFVIRPQTSSPPPEASAGFASVLLVPGGNGVLGLSASGDVQESQFNVLIRSGYRFLDRGLNVAMLDAGPGFPHPNGLTNLRHTEQNAAFLAKAIEVLTARWSTVPLWLIGTSNSTISVVNLAARLATLQLPLKGIVLTSTATRPNDAPGGEHHDVMSLNPGLSAIKIPTLVIWHKGDNCPISRSGNAAGVIVALSNVAAENKAEVVIDEGGSLAMPACSALSQHGFNGAENEVVRAIADFIGAHP
jgi:hypothetical protein